MRPVHHRLRSLQLCLHATFLFRANSRGMHCYFDNPWSQLCKGNFVLLSHLILSHRQTDKKPFIRCHWTICYFYVALNSLKHQWKILKKSIKRFQIAIFGSGLLWQHQTSVWLTSLNYGPRRSRDSEALANENKTSHIQCRGRDHSRVCPKTTYEKVKVDFCFTFNCYK